MSIRWFQSILLYIWCSSVCSHQVLAAGTSFSYDPSGNLILIESHSPTSPSLRSSFTSTAVLEGEPFSLSVIADGAPPLSYQWRRNGINIPGATSDSFALSAAQPSDAGTYSVVISNALGSLTQDIGSLSVQITRRDLFGITYAAGRFVAVGDSGTALVSTDGVAWTAANTGTSQTFEGITYGKNVFVAVGANGTVRASFDGISWSPKSSGVFTSLRAITFANGRFVAVGANGTIRTSTDGETWATGGSSVFEGLESVAFGDGHFVAVGQGGAIVTSTNGTTWERQSSGVFSTLNGVAFGNGSFVAVGAAGTFLTSSNALNWTKQTVGASGQFEGVIFHQNIFMAFGPGQDYFISADGVGWGRTASGTSRDLLAVASRIDRATAVGRRGLILTLPQPPVAHFDWTRISSPQYVDRPFNGTVTARDAAGRTVTDFVGAVVLSAIPDFVLLSPPSISNFVSGVAAVALTVRTPATNLQVIASDGTRLVGATAPFSVYRAGDLAVTGSASAQTLAAGSNLVYSIEVFNPGPTQASRVVAVDTLPPNVSFVSASSSSGSCSHSAGNVTCEVSQLPANGSLKITIQVIPSLADVNLTNRVAVVQNEPDPDPSNNTAVTVVSTIRSVLTLASVSLREGNLGNTNATFEARLSSASGRTVSVSYRTDAVSAQAGEDFESVGGQLIFNPGVTLQRIAIPIYGDISIEPDEVFKVALSNPSNVVLAATSVTGTILNDDGLPGNVQRFSWNTNPSPQYLDRPFSTKIEARDAFDKLATNFQGTVFLSAEQPMDSIETGSGTDPWQYPFTTSWHDARLQSIFPPTEVGAARTLVALSLDMTSPPGQPLNGWTIRLKHFPRSVYDTPNWETSGWTTVFKGTVYPTETGWQRFEFQQPFYYNGVDSLLVDFSFDNSSFSREGLCRSTVTTQLRSIYARIDSDYGNPLDWSGDGPPAPTATARVPNVRLEAVNPVRIDPDQIVGFKNGAWSGLLTIRELGSNVILRSKDLEGHLGSANPISVYRADDLSLAATVNSEIAATGQDVVYQFLLFNPGPLAASAVVVSNVLPATTAYRSAVVSIGTISLVEPSRILWNVGTLAPLATATATVVVQPRVAAISLTNVASMTRPGFDPNPGNDSVRLVNLVKEADLLIGDASIQEGGLVSRTLSFPVRLTAPSATAVMAGFRTLQIDSADGCDFSPIDGTLFFAAGETQRVVNVPILGDLEPEADETFRVQLEKVTGAIPLRVEAIGTIQNDDRVAGEVDRFEWQSISPLQYVNAPMEGRVSAVDVNGTLVRGYSGIVQFDAVNILEAVSGQLLPALRQTNQYSNNYTLGYTVTPSTNLTVTHFRHYFGEKVSLWEDCGTLLASVSLNVPSGSWTETALPRPLKLMAGRKYRLAAYTSGKRPHFWTDEQIRRFPHGQINETVVVPGDQFPSEKRSVQTYFVDMRYRVEPEEVLAVTPSSSTSFQNGVWNGQLMIPKVHPNLRLRARDADGRGGTSSAFQVLALAGDVSVSIDGPADAVEPGSDVAYQITVMNSGPGPASVLQLVDELPNHAKLISIASAQGSWSTNAGRLVWDIGSLDGARTAVARVTARPTIAATSVVHVVRLMSSRADANPANDSAQATTLVRPACLTVSNVAGFEGDFGSQSLRFTLLLSAPSAIPVSVAFRATNSLEADLCDFMPTNGTLAFNPGDMQREVPVRILPDTQSEADERIELVLSTVEGATTTTPTAIATLLNDDGVTGRVNRFVWEPITALQYVDRPIPVRIRALDIGNSVATNFFGAARLEALQLAQTFTSIMLPQLRQTNRYRNAYTLGYSFTPATDLVVTHLRRYFGEKISLWEDCGTLLATVAATNAVGRWTEIPLSESVRLTAGRKYRLAAYSTGANDHFWSDERVRVFPHGIINNTVVGERDTFPTDERAEQTYFVDLTYRVEPSHPVAFVPVGEITFQRGAWNGDVRIMGPGSNVVLRVTSPAGHQGTSSAVVVFDRPGDLVVGSHVSSEIVEPGEELEYEISVFNTGPASASKVQLEDEFASGIEILDIQTSAGRWVTNGIGHSWEVGTVPAGEGKFAKIHARAVLGSTTIQHRVRLSFPLDDANSGNNVASNQTEVLESQLRIDDWRGPEGDIGLTRARFRVSLDFPSAVPVSADYATEMPAQADNCDLMETHGTVRVVPGELFQDVSVDLVADPTAEPDEVFSVRLSNLVGAAGARTTANGFILNDDNLVGKVERFVWEPLAPQLYVDYPFPVRIRAVDINQVLATGFSGPVKLDAVQRLALVTGVVLPTLRQTNQSTIDYTLGYSLTPDTDLIVTHFRHYFGEKVSLWEDCGTLLAVASTVNSEVGRWTETALPKPLQLRAGKKYRLASYTRGVRKHYWSDEVIRKFNHGVINETVVAFRDQFPTEKRPVQTYFVDLRYQMVPEQSVTLLPESDVMFAGGEWVGAVTIPAAATNLVLRAKDLAGHMGEIGPVRVAREAPGELLRISLREGNPMLWWLDPRREYRLEMTESLVAPVRWRALNVPTTPLGEYIFLLDTLGSVERFYRLSGVR